MKIQELIEKYEKEKNEILDYQNSDIWKEEGILKQNSSVTALRWVFDFVEDLKKLDDQYKAKIPVYVDKWLKHCKWNNYPLSAATYDKNIKSFEKASNQTKLLEWFDTVKNQDVFARAWLDGYEVEEEPKYYVQLPFLEWNEEAAELEQTELYLGFDITSDETRFMTNKNGYRDFKTRLDEETIKAIDERYWPFAMPVEKV
ncbi:DUF1642 domain-containing protein [Enterococcus gilvus]|uniref:DUF1642 domain-containing protein n=1 Tax=Enterococcus gilvus TaxID=160453 RepID=UPI0028D2DD96|nr:DUF1642 domain-containing protein [Enterococcus gilvus]